MNPESWNTQTFGNHTLGVQFAYFCSNCRERLLVGGHFQQLFFSNFLAMLCEERKSDNLIHFSYLLSLSENIEIQHRYIGFSSFCISKLEIQVH